jgi:hypothetical protein
MNRRHFIESIVLVALSVFFAVLAWLSPEKSLSSTLPNPEISLWLYISYAEVSGALIVCALLVLLLPAPGAERSRSTRTRRVGLVLAVLGGIAWVIKTIANLFVPSSYILGTVPFTSLLEGTWKVSVGIPGISGIVYLLVGTTGFALFKSGSGRLQALVASVQTFAAPLVLFQQLTLLAYSPLAMIDHATNLLMIWEGGLQPFSNWLAFLVSSLLTIRALAANR